MYGFLKAGVKQRILLSQGLVIKLLRCEVTKKRILKREEEVDFFEQYEGVVFGVLKRMSIHGLHPDYEEFAQIGRMGLVRAYEEFAEDPAFEEHQGSFVSYAFTKIRWAILDEIRRKTRQREREQVWDESYDATIADEAGDFSKSILEDEWLKSILHLLNAEEKRLVIDLCIYRLTMTEIAKKEGVSRKTIYKRRKNVQSKLFDVVYGKKGDSYEINYY